MVLFLCTIFLFLSNNVNAQDIISQTVPTTIDGTTVSTTTRQLTYNTTGSYYEINDYIDLRVLSYYVMSGKNCKDKTFKLINDIDMSASNLLVYTSTTDWAGASNFLPIGGWSAINNNSYSSSNYFKGTFDGNNKTITGLKILKGTSSYYVGLFGYCYGATINNININNATIQGHIYVGLISGWTSSTNISNCTVSNSTVIGSGNGSIGGLVGQSTTSNILTNCYVRNSNITLKNMSGAIGGICGY
jgi:hypothetical protein